MEVIAVARYLRITPRKARLVAATVIGMPVKDALTVLEFTPKAAAKEVGKVVKSAAANATNNFNQDEDTLVVKRIVVNEGPTLKRGQARARGMYFSIFKRTSHITAIVEAAEAPVRGRRRAAATAAPKAAAKPIAKRTDTGKAAEAKASATKASRKDSGTDVKADAAASEATAVATDVATDEAPALQVVAVETPVVETPVAETPVAETAVAESAAVEETTPEASVEAPAADPVPEVLAEPEPEPTPEELAAAAARKSMTPHERALHDLREGRPDQTPDASPEPTAGAETKTKTEEDKA